MFDEFAIEAEGLDEAIDAVHRAPNVINRKLEQGLMVAIEDTLSQEGLRRYPPRSAANRPPRPYYKRGVGYYRKRGLVASSERLGTQFYAKATSTGRLLRGIGGQRASYGPYVVGNRQPLHMKRKGWRTMKRVAKLQARKMGKILTAYVMEALAQLDLVDRMRNVFKE